MPTPLCLADIIDQRAIIASTLIDGETDTALGERQLWLYLIDDSSIEVTYETAGLAPENAFWSITYHASNAWFDMTNEDILDKTNLTSTASFTDALDEVIAILKYHLLEGNDVLACLCPHADDVADLLHAYDRYVQTANDVDVYASGWRPVSIGEFATHEYLNVWCETPADEREDCFAYLGDQ